MSADVIVIGGGVSGLATAFDLMRHGHKVIVLERQVRIGGNAISERIGGFLMEHGPSSISASSAQAVALSQALGLVHQRCNVGPGTHRRYLVNGGALQGISIGPFGFLTSSYLSLGGRLRLAAEIMMPCGVSDHDESVADFCRRRFGAEFVDRVIDPLVGGMFAGKAEDVSMAATFPKLRDMERTYGSIIRAMICRRRSGNEMPGRRLFSWREGVASLPRALAARLGAAVGTGITVRRIIPRARGIRVEAGEAGAFEARTVVIATQPHVAAALLDGVDADGAAAAAAIEAPPLAIVFLGFHRRQVAHPLDGLGYLTPVAEGRPLTGALFASSMFAGRAPEDHVAVAGYIGGVRAPDLARLPAAELVEMTRGEFADLIGARGDPVVANVRQWPLGLPQYRVGHAELIKTLTATEHNNPGLFFTGNYLGGVSVAACLDQAADTTARVDEFLLSRTRNTNSAASSRIVATGVVRAIWPDKAQQT